MGSNKPVVIILAAGESKRMGSPKQLLEYQGKSLLDRSIETCLATGMPVLVVLGAYRDQTEAVTKNYPVHIAINENWTSGIASSIKTGIAAAVNNNADLSGVLITLVDQPQVSSTHLQDILHLASKGFNLVATEFNGVVGVPAFFQSKYLTSLNKLKGDSGARLFLQINREKVITIPFSPAALDIDTEKDWRNFLKEDKED